MKNFNNGVNLGGWLSQYPKYDHAHFGTFISQGDIKQIASWGMDHVRLPVDYPVLEADDAPGIYSEEGFRYIDACMEWCQAAGLGIILDLHRAPGYNFSDTLMPETKQRNVLFGQGEAQQRFVSLWESIVRRYHDAGSPILFELLNEVVLPDSAPWNSLVHRTVAALRAIAPVCEIMIGGNNYNAAGELKNIELFDDPHISYTFHFYEPLLFTHQKAPWSQEAMEYNQDISYPGSFPGLEEFVRRAPQWREKYGWQSGRAVNRALMLEFLQPALGFIQQTSRDLYCGEFGVIEHVDPASRQNWHADLVAILKQYNVGRAVWSYKQMDFGLVDANGKVVDPQLLQILCDQ